MDFDKISILGSDTILGQALLKQLKCDKNISVQTITSKELNQFTPKELTLKLKSNNISIVFNTHNRGGGLGFLKKVPADLFMENISIDIHFIPSCYKAGVKKYVNILPNCVYPNGLPVPYLESQIWEGLPENTVAPYSMTKKISILQSKAFKHQYSFNSINLIVTAVYGPNDNFHTEESQVIPAMIIKFDQNIEKNTPFIKFWGSGNATREFIYVDDAASGIIKAAKKYDQIDPLNICSGEEWRIKDLAIKLAKIIGYKGDILWDKSKPEGCFRKCLSAEKMKKQIHHELKYTLEEGLKKTVDWYNFNEKHHRKN